MKNHLKIPNESPPDDGWITARNAVPSPDRAVLLIPVDECLDPTCLEDVSGDGVVNVTDLLALLGTWGGCLGSGCTGSAQIPQSVNDCLNMVSGCYNQCMCIKKLCATGTISTEECAGYQNVICDPECNNN